MRQLGQGLLLVAAFALAACDGGGTSPTSLPAASTSVAQGKVIPSRTHSLASGNAGASLFLFPPSWEPAFGTRLDLFDDDCEIIVLPFVFNYFGVPYTTIGVQSNGNVTPGSCSSAGSPYEWGTESGAPVINNVPRIAPFYTDFYPPDGDVYQAILGVPGQRRFVATWFNTPLCCSEDNDRSTFQVQIFEGTDQIQFGHADLTGFYDEVGGGLIAGTGGGDEDEVASIAAPGFFIRTITPFNVGAFVGTNTCFTPVGGTTYSVLFARCGLPPGGTIRGFGSVNVPAGSVPSAPGFSGGASTAFVALQNGSGGRATGFFSFSMPGLVASGQAIQAVGSQGGNGFFTGRGICTGGPCIFFVTVMDAQAGAGPLTKSARDLYRAQIYRVSVDGSLGALLVDTGNGTFQGSIIVSR